MRFTINLNVKIYACTILRSSNVYLKKWKQRINPHENEANQSEQSFCQHMNQLHM